MIYRMDSRIQKQIIDYYAFFEEFYNSTKSNLKDCQKCAISIIKLINRCKNIKEAEILGSPLETFDGLQEKLCASIYNLISDDIKILQNKQSVIQELFLKLCYKKKVFTESCREIDFTIKTALIKGTPLQPPLKVLMQFAEDTITFGSEICAKIETSLSVLAIRGLKTESLVDNFNISQSWDRRCKEIIAYTSFCPENEI